MKISLEASECLIGADHLWLLRFEELEHSFAIALPLIQSIVEAMPPGTWLGFLGPNDVIDISVINEVKTTQEAQIVASLGESYVSQQERQGLAGHHRGWCPIFLERVDYIRESVLVRAELFQEKNNVVSRVVDLPNLVISSYEQSPRSVLWAEGHIVSCEARSEADSAKTLLLSTGNRRNGPADNKTASSTQDISKSQYQPSVEIVVPFRDRRNLTLRLIWSIFTRTRYSNFLLVLIDNGSKDKFLKVFIRLLSNLRLLKLIKEPGDFNFSTLMNSALKECEADIFVSLNNDIEILDAEWLSNLILLAVRPDVGPVGCQLRFPDGRIQHNGVVLGTPGLAHHVFEGQLPAEKSFSEQAFSKTWSAVTAACMVIETEKLRTVGGFNENFRVGGGDVDLCLRLAQRGLRSVVQPQTVLTHLGKATRGEHSVFPEDVRQSIVSYGSPLLDGDSWFSYLKARNERGWLETAIQTIERTSQARPEAKPAPGGLLQNFGHQHEDKAPTEDPRPSVAHEAAVWFVPEVDSITRGGIHTALRVANFLSTHRGLPQLIVVCPLGTSTRWSIAKWESELSVQFPKMSFTVIARKDFESTAEGLVFLLGFATLWTTAYHLLQYRTHFERSLYFVQDYEPEFLPASAEAELVRETYRLGLEIICNTPSVENAVLRDSKTVGSFVPGISEEYSHVRDWKASVARDDKPLRVILFSRPGNPRNGFNAVAGLAHSLKTHYETAVQLITVGSAFDEEEFGLSGLVINLGSLPSRRHVAALYRSGDVGVALSFSNHLSYQPLEMMKCGLPLISNRSGASDWLLTNRFNSLLSGPSVRSLFETVKFGIDHPAVRESIRANAIESVRTLTWQASMQQIENLIFTQRTSPGRLHKRETP